MGVSVFDVYWLLESVYCWLGVRCRSRSEIFLLYSLHYAWIVLPCVFVASIMAYKIFAQERCDFLGVSPSVEAVVRGIQKRKMEDQHRQSSSEIPKLRREAQFTSELDEIMKTWPEFQNSNGSFA